MLNDMNERKIEKFTNFDVDAVITWVDSTDTRWITEYNKFNNNNYNVENSFKIRFANIGELYYCLKGITTYLPWINNIYLVLMRPQKPTYINEFSKVKIIYHDEIYKNDHKEHLPVFNSMSIETQLHNIPNLTEHFLYFNDDVFIGKPLNKDIFFTNNGQINFYNRTHQNKYSRISNNIINNKYKINLKNTAPQHQVFSLRKSYLNEVWKLFSKELENTSRSRFRSDNNIWMINLIYQLGNTTILNKPKCNYLDLSEKEIVYISMTDTKKFYKKKLLNKFKKNIPSFICITNIDSTKQADIDFWNLFKKYYNNNIKNILLREK